MSENETFCSRSGKWIGKLIGTGQLDRAQALLDMYEERARQVGRDWAVAVCRRSRAMLLAARGEPEAAIATAGEAVSLIRVLDLPPLLARALLTQGIILRRVRRRADARQTLEEALGIFESTGMRLWVDRARQEMERLGLHRRARENLTQTERRVAELAGEGKTNREIAEALFISAKTVEANLARIYRKLGIGSRAELGARLARTQGT